MPIEQKPAKTVMGRAARRATRAVNTRNEPAVSVGIKPHFGKKEQQRAALRHIRTLSKASTKGE